MLVAVVFVQWRCWISRSRGSDIPFTFQLFAVVVPAVARLSWLYEDATVWFWFRITSGVPEACKLLGVGWGW